MTFARVKKAVMVAAVGGLAVAGALVVASPAQAHNASYNCTTWWATGGTGATINCSGGVAGDNGQLRLQCIQIDGSGTQYKYSAILNPNGTSSAYCSLGYEPLDKMYRENYSDGHTTGWIH